jgi:hypothetical protein
MKYLITESQLDNVIFKYLDSKRFTQIEKGNSIYFVKSEGNVYGLIKYDKDNGWCTIRRRLIDEISRFFSLGNFDSEEIIGKWVENTLNMRVVSTFQTIVGSVLRIPSN